MAQISGFTVYSSFQEAQLTCTTGKKVAEVARSGAGTARIRGWVCVPNGHIVNIFGGPTTGQHWGTVIQAAPAAAAPPTAQPTTPPPSPPATPPAPPATPAPAATAPPAVAPGPPATAPAPAGPSPGTQAASSALAAAIQDIQNNPQISPAFNDQCFLIEKAKDIYASMGAQHRPTPVTPHTAIRVRQLSIGPLTGRGHETNLQYINKITELSKTRNFFEITPAETAQLAHYAAIFVANRRPGGHENLKPIFGLSESQRDLPNNLSMFQDAGRRTGAGIQSIDITYEGIDSATKKIVLVNATYLFQDIRTMLETDSGKGVPYGELFRLATCENCTTANKTFRTIDFEIGWKGRKHTIGSETESLAKRLNLERLVLKLRTNLVKYTFDLKQDGAVVVTAQYRGHIVDVLGGPSSNILAYSKNIYTSIRNNLAAIENSTSRIAQERAQEEKELAYLAIARTLVKESIVRRHGQNPRRSNTRHSDPLKRVQFIQKLTADLGNVNTNTAGTSIRKLTAAGGQSWSAADKNLLQLEVDHQVRELNKHLMAIPASDPQYAEKAADVIQNAIRMEAIAAATAASAATRSGQAMARHIALSQQIKQAKMAKFAALQEIGKKMLATDDLHYAFVLRRPTIERFQILASGRDPSGAGGGYAQKLTTLINGLQPANFVTKRNLTERELDNDTFQVIPFVFLGKLIENILALPTDPPPPSTPGQPPAAPSTTVYQSMLAFTGASFNVDFGYVTYKQPYTGELNENFPLYYLPISLTKINNFFAREVVAKEREFFAFNDFLLAVLQKFLTNIFSVCVKESNSPAFLSPKIQTVVGNARERRRRNLQYFIYGFKNVEQDVKNGNIMFGNYTANWRNHIYHFYLGGQIKGAVKNVKVTDIADETTKTAIYYQQRASAREGTDPNNIAQYGGFPPVVFQAEVETIGFPMFNMGQLIYIDLQPYVSDKNSRQFKANGYYGVTKVSHTFTVDSFSSKVSAILQYSKWDKDNPSTPKASSTGSPSTPAAAGVNPQLEAIKAESERIKRQTEWLTKIAGGEAIDPNEPFPGELTAEQLAYQERLTNAKTAYTSWRDLPANMQYQLPQCKFKTTSGANQAHYNILLGHGYWGSTNDECP